MTDKRDIVEEIKRLREQRDGARNERNDLQRQCDDDGRLSGENAALCALLRRAAPFLLMHAGDLRDACEPTDEIYALLDEIAEVADDEPTE